MHAYIYDSFLDEKKYSSTLAKIETRITDLGLSGKVVRLSVIKNINEMIKNELGGRVKTIVAVGNDKTINLVASALLDSSLPLGIIPIKNNYNKIAESIGVPLEETACDVLAARRIEKIDIGLANNSCFLADASISSAGTIIEINKNYTIEVQEKSTINIINLPSQNMPHLPLSAVASNPKDGILELCISSDKKSFWESEKNKQQSLIPVSSLNIINIKNAPLIIDRVLKISTPAFITVAKQKLNIIVGKKRIFA
jgi:hypothetical protein